MSTPVLTFLHPIGLDRQCAGFVPQRWGFVPNLPGHGGRDWPGPGTGLAEMADLIAAEGPARMHVVGALMGGSVALHLALRHPHRVASMVIAGTSTRTDHATLLARAAVVEAGDLLVETTLAKWFPATKLAERPERLEIAYVRDSLSRMSPAALGGSWRALGCHDVRAEAGRIAVPVTFVAGSHDTVHPPEEAEANARLLPVGRVAVVDSTHMIPLDNPLGLSAAIDDHLKWLRTAKH